MSMFDVIKERTQSMSEDVGRRIDDDLRNMWEAIYRFDENLRNLILSQHDEDSDDEGDGEFSRYKSVAKSAFRSPSALANKLGKRGGIDPSSCSHSGASSRRIKNQFRSDPKAPKILQEISSATAVKSGQSVVSLREVGAQEQMEGEGAEQAEPTFFDDDECAVLSSFQREEEAAVKDDTARNESQ